MVSNMDLLIRNGRLVGPEGIKKADVRIIGEYVSEIAPSIHPSNDVKIIDASGKLILPGGIDPHTHLSPPWVDDLTSGSAAALAGGITTVGTFAYPELKDGERETLVESLHRMGNRVNKEAIADVILHTFVWPPSMAAKEQLEAILYEGQPSIKFFTLIKGFGAAIKEVLEVMEKASRLGILVMMHCEDEALLTWAAMHLRAEGKSSLRYYAESRPIVSEVAATQQVVALCEATKAPTYIVHISSARALRACRNDDTKGLPLYVETRPIYLELTEEKYLSEEGPLYVGQPPLRGPSDVDALWNGLIEGKIDVLATDHAPWTRDQKLDPKLDIEKLRPGIDNLQVMLPMYFSEGVSKGRITIERFVETTSTNPAKIFGLFPRKGVIREDSYADVVVWDPNLKKEIHASESFSKADFSIFEGWRVTGWPILTVRRGKIVFEDGKVKGTPGSGKLLKRDPWRAHSQIEES
jgi:dihydropyrimidinase